jgi:hypothetical protein
MLGTPIFFLKSSAMHLPRFRVDARSQARDAVRERCRGASILAGPQIDDPKAWDEYRRCHPDRRYAVRKRTISRRELERHGLSNLAER